MMPVPSHLVDCVIPKESTIDENPLDAVVRCPCGSTVLELLYPGQTHDFEGEAVPCVAEIDGKLFFLIKGRCTACHRSHLLFDMDFHGWNGFVCHDAEQAAIPRPSLVPWACLSCGVTAHEASVEIQTEGKGDFVAEAGQEFDVNRWPDAFGWFSMTIRCIGCGKQTCDWISYETM
jgi:hypothetical protein